MKLVINGCCGGFSLSPIAVKRLAELNGQPCYFFKSERTDSLANTRYVPITPEEAGASFMWSAFTVPNPNDIIGDAADWRSMTMEERKAHNDRHTSIRLDQRPEKRDDPKLVQVVEELGKKADGSCAELRVVDIPDGIEWQLSEYDGIERVEEQHRSWS